MALARIGVGSNVGDAAGNVERALAALRRFGGVDAVSSLYRTAPWGVAAQPSFVNAAALLETELSPDGLLRALKALEAELGRVATTRWGPRVIDLDILAYDDVVCDAAHLTLPHPRLHERAFALGPLAEIDPAYRLAYAALPAAERADVQRIRQASARNARAVHWDETLERVRAAAAFCAGEGLVRLRVEDRGLEIELRRSARSSGALPPPATDEALATESSSNGTTATASRLRVLRAEFVGIVRLSRPAVTPGSVLGGDRELAYVESLGIRNPIRSGGAGRVTEVFVSDGEAVEYGQPLVAVEPGDV